MIRALRILFSAMTFIGLFDGALAQENAVDTTRRNEIDALISGNSISAEAPGYRNIGERVLHQWRSLADQGDLEREYDMARFLIEGAYPSAFPKDIDAGRAYLEKAVAQGYAPAMFYLVRKLHDRVLSAPEPDRADKLLRKLIMGRYPQAVAYYGERLIKMSATEVRSLDQGVRVLTSGLAEHNVFTNFVWGKYHLEHLERWVPPANFPGYNDSDRKIIREGTLRDSYIALSLAAGGGHRMAKAYLAQQLIYGLPEKRDPARGIGMLQELLGDEQNRQAYWRLGEAYLRGVDGHLNRDVGKGLDLLTAAAEEGHCGAIHSLIEAYGHAFVDHPDFPTDALRADQFEALWTVLPKNDAKAAHWRGKQTSCLRNAWDYDEDWWQ